MELTMTDSILRGESSEKGCSGLPGKKRLVQSLHSLNEMLDNLPS